MKQSCLDILYLKDKVIVHSRWRPGRESLSFLEESPPPPTALVDQVGIQAPEENKGGVQIIKMEI